METTPGGCCPISTTHSQSPGLINPEFLVFRATPQGYVSYTDDVGSDFIKPLCKVLEEEAQKQKQKQKPRNLLDLFTVVNRLVSESEIPCEGNTFKQIPEIKSTLTKLVFLTPTPK